MGTFALAMAFAGNDLVNFIGVPLAAYSAFQDFTANGAGDAYGLLMGSLNGSAKTRLCSCLRPELLCSFSWPSQRRRIM